MNKDTVSMHFVAAAVARLAPSVRVRVLNAVGVPLDLLASPHARVPAQSFSRLWLEVAREIDDEFFGLDRRRMKVGSFALLSHAVLGCGNLDRALKQMLRGFTVFLDDVRAELTLDDGLAAITLVNTIADAQSRRFADETYLVMIHGLASWLAGRRLPLVAVEFAHPRPAHADEYAVMFTPQLGFDAPATAMRFEAQLLAAPVVQDAARLKRFLQSAPQSVFLKYKNEDSWTARLRRRLRHCTGDEASWPLFEDLAREFHITPTTLRRRLEAEGSGYQRIKDELRRDLAIHQLCSTDASMAEIGSRIGFQEPSAFYRAFKRWSGVQPGEYRARQGRQSAE
jgi:AraC-like DNA-binding protein